MSKRRASSVGIVRGRVGRSIRSLVCLCIAFAVVFKSQLLCLAVLKESPPTLSLPCERVAGAGPRFFDDDSAIIGI